MRMSPLDSKSVAFRRLLISKNRIKITTGIEADIEKV